MEYIHIVYTYYLRQTNKQIKKTLHVLFRSTQGYLSSHLAVFRRLGLYFYLINSVHYVEGRILYHGSYIF